MRRVRLKCLNWYGAHQETLVSGGLEERDVPDLVQSFKSTDANCARLTYSIHMVVYNPIVKPEFIKVLNQKVAVIKLCMLWIFLVV